ncbi:Tfp pilus assembly protein FimT/FimU [Verrucomicrobiota bacterium]
MENRTLRTRTGFTLIELLLVIVLICVITGIAIPSFVRSVRAHRLATAARTLVTVSRYARSMALLKQSDLVITFNLDTGHIDLVSSNTTLPRFSRVVKGVSLACVDLEGSGSPATEGTCTVPYSRNGVCTPFSVKVVDPLGNYVVVKVDALSSVRTMTHGTE